ncbi:MAG: hypothetical protein J6Y23_06620, partial [Prevotella sp.]|nr:hypothetical protein [Prevotella sp.]
TPCKSGAKVVKAEDNTKRISFFFIVEAPPTFGIAKEVKAEDNTKRIPFFFIVEAPPAFDKVKVVFFLICCAVLRFFI